jgi:hypothetical protein
MESATLVTDLANATVVQAASDDSPAASAVAQKSASALKNASAGVLVAMVLSILVLGALALPQYAIPRAVPAVTVRQSDVHALPQQPLAVAQSDTPAVKTNATPVRVDPTTESLPVSQVKAAREINGRTNNASDAGAARKLPGESTRPIATLLPVAAGDADGEPVGFIAAAVASTALAASRATADTAGLTTVTITGCLEVSVDEERFRLTDTEGANAPKARSWRSGFLRKRSAPMDLVELADPLTAQQYVGKRVVATGLVENRQMHVRSLQAAGPSCNQ